MNWSDSAYIRRFFSLYSQEEKDKVRGHAFYPSDYLSALLPEDVLHVHVVRSPYPAAHFTKIDCSEAEKIEGVEKIITWADIPKNRSIAGAGNEGQLILPEGRVRFRGQPVALIVANDLVTAQRAEELMKIDWKPGDEVADEVVETVHFSSGKAPAGKQEFVESDFKFPSLHARYLEPESGWVSLESDKLSFQIGSLLSESQRLWLSEVLGVPVSSITAREAYLGGQFGGRQQREMIAFLGIASWLTKKSCCLHLEYQNQDVGSYGYSGHLKISYDSAASSMKQLQGEIQIDAGAFEGNAVSVLRKALEHAACIYSFEHVALVGKVVRTQSHPRRALKGEALTSVTWATEQLVDQVAKALDIPPLDFRRAHCRADGGSSLRVIDETEKVERPFRLLSGERHRATWDAKMNVGRGFAFQVFQSQKESSIDELEVSVELQVSGSFVIRTSNHTLDMHMKSALCEVAASVLKTHPKAFTVEGEMRIQFEKPRKRETYPEFYYLAQATWHAADRLRSRLKEVAQQVMRGETIELQDGAVVVKDTNRKMGYRELAFTHGAQDLKTNYILKTADKPHGCSAGAVSRVSFHPLTGELNVDSVKVIVDAGPVVRETGLETEAEYAVSWALAALFSTSFERDQPIPTALDGPDEVQLIPLEYPLRTYGEEAPDYFGSRGVTDVLMAVVLASLVTAIQDAKGTSLKQIPMLSEFMYPEERASRPNMIQFPKQR